MPPHPSKPRFGFVLTAEILGLLLANLIHVDRRDVATMLCGALVGIIFGAILEHLAPKFEGRQLLRLTLFWLAVPVVTLPLYYVVMFGPACWTTRDCDANVGPRIYWPMGYLAARSYPGPIHQVLAIYAGGSSDGRGILWIPASPGNENSYAEFKR